LEPRLGVVEINLIASSTPDEIVNAVNDMQSRGATHFVLDLRGNSGGLLEAGVDVVRLFLESGEIINQQFRDKEEKVFRVRKTGELADIPIAVIVDHYTASAAEIIAGALQNQGRSVLIGSPTYGKYSVQLIFNLKDGSSIHVTAGRWWIPEFEFPSEGYGLIPDIGISPDDEDPNAAIELAIQTFFSGD
jgi:carboxyl-terminal processing protease